ncbi:hypothetical protein SISSUDRAFT_1066523 [Sistotremastrum suecicum HHB10207 ss-3]|uniref:Uncharacterized protein n=1 Tax=Sistotremastrum suecicum HHB10207 ss-3 TaxID=1314776 RepID=A0A165Y7W8_9AGAM|nr:hypothetical protein SISSUDRAFT_1066523 [Sistotremastrum suecicum HHB10207 ss-3]
MYLTSKPRCILEPSDVVKSSQRPGGSTTYVSALLSYNSPTVLIVLQDPRASCPPQAINGCNAIGSLCATRHIVDHRTRMMEARHSQILLFQKITFVNEVNPRSSVAFEGVLYVRIFDGFVPDRASVRSVLSFARASAPFRIHEDNESHPLALELTQRA